MVIDIVIESQAQAQAQAVLKYVLWNLLTIDTA